MTRGTGLFLRAVLSGECALVRADAQVVPDAHRQTIGEQVGGADDKHGSGGQSPAGDAGDDRERRDETVVRAVHHVSNVVAGDRERPVRFSME